MLMLIIRFTAGAICGAFIGLGIAHLAIQRMKVYIVIDSTWEHESIEKVFINRSDAQHYTEKNANKAASDLLIEEHEVIE